MSDALGWQRWQLHAVAYGELVVVQSDSIAAVAASLVAVKPSAHDGSTLQVLGPQITGNILNPDTEDSLLMSE